MVMIAAVEDVVVIVGLQIQCYTINYRCQEHNEEVKKTAEVVVIVVGLVVVVGMVLSLPLHYLSSRGIDQQDSER